MSAVCCWGFTANTRSLTCTVDMRLPTSVMLLASADGAHPFRAVDAYRNTDRPA